MEIVLRNFALIGDKEVTTIRSDDGSNTFYFAAKELATALGYIETRSAVTRHTKEWMRTTLDEIRRGVKHTSFHISGSKHPDRVFVTEPGLYSLVSHSKLPAAEDFQRWVFEDVLPSIRKTGTYTLPGVMPAIDNVKDEELCQLPEKERIVAHGKLTHKNNLVKDPEAVARGKKGGLTVQENNRRTKKILRERGAKILELEEERDKLEEERDDLEDERDRLEEKVQDLRKELFEKTERIHELEDENERLWIENEKLATTELADSSINV
ncbi:Hypothetical predicted protein [Paramuricea clavata]|uniref:Uncharacterized protein n=1 Tax=Paramuricea clavata TaxID=317549 RepID=A0A6S7GGC2_PARCT|nr:Hypothetical predicted protein [Paramuricea clavata]